MSVCVSVLSRVTYDERAQNIRRVKCWECMYTHLEFVLVYLCVGGGGQGLHLCTCAQTHTYLCLYTYVHIHTHTKTHIHTH